MKKIYLKHRKHFLSFPADTMNLKKKKASIVKTIMYSKKSINLITFNGLTVIKNRNNIARSVIFNGTLVRSSLSMQFDFNYPGILLF